MCITALRQLIIPQLLWFSDQVFLGTVKPNTYIKTFSLLRNMFNNFNNLQYNGFYYWHNIVFISSLNYLA